MLVADNPSIEDTGAEGYAALPTELPAVFDEALRGEARKRLNVARREAVERGIHITRLHRMADLAREEQLGLIERVMLVDGSALIIERDPFALLPLPDDA